MQKDRFLISDNMNASNETSSLKLIPVRAAPLFAVGILVYFAAGWYALLLLIAAIPAVLITAKRKMLSVCALALIAGLSSAVLYDCVIYKPVMSADSTTQQLVCRVTDVHDLGGYYHYTCDTEIYGRSAEIDFYSEQPLLLDDCFTADIALKTPPQVYYNKWRPVLSGNAENIRDIQRPTFSIIRVTDDFRAEIEQSFTRSMDGDILQLAQGTILGNTADFSLKLRHSARVSGVSHFFAVSGMHFAIIMTVLLELYGNRNAKKRAVTAILYIPLAVLFFGCEAGVLRAGIMMLLYSCGPLFCRKADTLNSLCIAVIAMTAFSPYVVLDIGFQMSVLGVFGVSVLGNRCCYLLHRRFPHIPVLLGKLADAIISSACAVICISPVSIGAFGGISLVGVFATVALTPFFTLALIFAVLFAVTRLEFFLIPISLLMKCANDIVLFFGQSNSAWLTMDHSGAAIIAAVFLLALCTAVFFSDKLRRYSLYIAAISAVLSLSLCANTAATRSKISFVSDGTDGAAIVCSGSEAVILICGSGGNITYALDDRLMRCGIRRITMIAAPDLTVNGAIELSDIADCYDVSAVCADAVACDMLSVMQPNISMQHNDSAILTVNGTTVSCAKSGDTSCIADVVLYYGYKKSVPKNSAGIALYTSSRQNLLPENGINIYDEIFELKPEK